MYIKRPILFYSNDIQAVTLAYYIYSGDTGLFDASWQTSDSKFTTSEEEPAENQLQVQLLNTPGSLEVSDDNDSRLEQGSVSAEEQQGTQRRSLLEMIGESSTEEHKQNDQTSTVLTDIPRVSRELVLDND
ncbi:hypothetical protein RRG08_065001 [Elysia crispata]|uniref:Uncharacterized protein n=1 Tax=Elysia crispata TaxID=231223 RepID=A0AAE1DH06_9GAST|nr:hypothetical protein RRG08_065001 [Elysia crispata]